MRITTVANSFQEPSDAELRQLARLVWGSFPWLTPCSEREFRDAFMAIGRHMRRLPAPDKSKYLQPRCRRGRGDRGGWRARKRWQRGLCRRHRVGPARAARKPQAWGFVGGRNVAAHRDSALRGRMEKKSRPVVRRCFPSSRRRRSRAGGTRPGATSRRRSSSKRTAARCAR